MTPQDILDAILKYGLSIRQIPTELTEIINTGDPQSGDVVTEWPKESNHTRCVVQRVTIPKHAGYWMCQQVKDTSSAVRWNIKTNHLAPTLEESVALFLKSTESQPKILTT